MRFRIMYEVKGFLAYLSHLDMMRLWQRAMLRSQLPVSWSKGYNPRPRLSLGPAKGVGIAGCGEYIDMELDSYHLAADVKAKLNAVLPSDLRVLKARELPEGSKLLEAVINCAEYEMAFPSGTTDELAAGVSAFMALEICPFVRHSPKGDKTVDLRNFVRSLRIDGENLVLDAKVGPQGAIRPEEILTDLGYKSIIGTIKITRRALYIEKNGGRSNP